MAIFKVDQLFTLRDAGWTETLYREEAAIGSALSAGVTLAKRRIRLSAKPTRLNEVRASDIAVRNDSLVAAVNLNNDGEANYTEADRSWTAALCRMNSTEAYRRPYYIRGINDGVTYPHRLDRATKAATFLQFFNLWKTQIINNDWGFLGLDKSPVTNPEIGIQAAGLGANNKVQITIVNHGFVGGEKINVTGIQSDPTVSGVFTVVFEDENVFYLLETNFLRWTYTGSGFIRPIARVLRTITSIQDLRITRKLSGPGPRQLVARRKRRPC